VRLSEIAEQFQRISSSRAEAASAVDTCVQALARAHFLFERAHAAAKMLDDAHALVRSEAAELRELCERLQLAEAVLSEAAFAVAEFHNDPALMRITLKPLAKAARDGMQAKLLANWEAEFLRNVVVAALAGKPETP